MVDSIEFEKRWFFDHDVDLLIWSDSQDATPDCTMREISRTGWANNKGPV